MLHKKLKIDKLQKFILFIYQEKPKDKTLKIKLGINLNKYQILLKTGFM